MKVTHTLFWKFFITLTVGTCFLTVGITSFYYLTIARYLPLLAIQENLKNFLIVLLSFELVFVFSVSLVFLHLLKKYNDQMAATQNFFELLLEIISHKLGNFMAGQNVNISLLNTTGSQEAVARMEKSILLMEQDLADLLSSLSAVRENSLCPDLDIDISDLIERERHKHRCSMDGRDRGKTVIIGGSGSRLKKAEYSFIIGLLLENAFKYSRKKIKIRIGHFRDRDYFFVSNDIAKDRSGGLGIGLTIVSHICSKNNCTFKLGNSKKNFRALVLFPGPV